MDFKRIRSASANRQGAIFLLLLCLLALVLRLYMLRFHDVISTDGTSYVGTARAILSGEFHPLAIYGFYPAVMALASLFGPGIETAGRLVSVLSGSLLLAPLYLLGTALFSRRTALLACLITAVWSPLVGWSCEVMTQATYIALDYTGIYLVWRMFERPTVRIGWAAGTVLALAFLTRPEGFLLFFIMPLVPLFVRRKTLSATWPALFAYGAAFILLFGLNLVLIHHVTGVWQLSAKTGSALMDALALYLRVPDLGYMPSVEAIGYLQIIRDYPDFVWTNTIKNLKGVWTTLLPPYFWFLAAAGAVAGAFGAEHNRQRLFLISSFAPLLVIVTFYYNGLEYTQPYLPGLFLLSAEGLCLMERALVAALPGIRSDMRQKWRGSMPMAIIVTVILASTILVRQIPADTSQLPYNPESDGGRRDHKSMGLLIKEHLPPGKIMTRWARIAYYAEREWVTIPKAGLEEIIKSARENGVRFIVVDGGLQLHRPQLGILYSPFRDRRLPEKVFLKTPDQPLLDNGLRPYLLYNAPDSMGVAVYEIPI